MNECAFSGVARGPLQILRPQDMRRVPVGTPVRSLAPQQVFGLLVCRINGEWISRESWDTPTQPGEVIEWHDIPEDRDTLRGVLQIAITIAGAYFGGIPGFLITLGASTAVNILLPPVGPEAIRRAEQTGEVFSTSLQGNESRIDQPIWKICGQREITPPYACQPYFEFRSRPGDSDADPDLDNDQYFFALFSVGIGNHDVVAKIGNTPITRFGDVLLGQYLEPGVQPSQVLANVVTAVEVSSQILESGRYVGGIAACRARSTCSAIGIDVTATRGLGKTGALTVSWRVETRTINDFGQVLTPWEVLGTESRTAFTATPQRWSVKYELGSDAARVEVRVVRTDVQDTDPAALHEIAWTGLRAYLAEPAPLNPYAAHFEVVMRASSQLSQQASRDLRLIVQSYVRTLNASLAWQIEEHSRNWVWWVLDLLTSSTWGMDKPDDRIDLQSFYDEAVKADDRQDRFDYVFDSTVNAWDAAQLIARAGRCRIFRRNGVISIARDEFVDVPVTAFSSRNCTGIISIAESLPGRTSPDGVIVEYQDHRTNEWTEIPCPLPGLEVSDMTAPVFKRLEGIIGATHAEREGRYEAASLLYRSRTATWSTEMQGMLPAYMSPVYVQPDIVGYGQSGDVCFWDSGALLMELSEVPDWDAGGLLISFVDDDGTITTAISVSPGPNPYEVILASTPSASISWESGERERTKFLLGPAVGSVELVKVATIADGGRTDDGAQLFELTGLIDDERVHTADNDLLPGPGVIQDPVGLPDGGDSEPGITILSPRILDKTLIGFTSSGVSTDVLYVRYILGATGLLTTHEKGAAGITTISHSSEWMLYGEIEPTDAALFEVRATLISQNSIDVGETFTGTLGTWLAMGVDLEWKLEYVSPASGTTAQRIVYFEIREAASGLVQDFATIDMSTPVFTEVGGA